MARLTDEQWACVRADYEIRGMSFNELSAKYSIGKATISDKKKKDAQKGDDWVKSKTEQLIQRKIRAIKKLRGAEQQTELLKPNELEAVNNEVLIRLAREKIFVDSALRNQSLANEYLNLCESELGAVDLDDLNKHSQLTARNKETVLGKQPDTAIQVNNNLTPRVIERVIIDPKGEYNEDFNT